MQHRHITRLSCSFKRADVVSARHAQPHGKLLLNGIHDHIRVRALSQLGEPAFAGVKCLFLAFRDELCKGGPL